MPSPNELYQQVAGSESEPADVPRQHRIRRKMMNVETFARYCGALGKAIAFANAEFDPSPQEVQLALDTCLRSLVAMVPTAKRRTS